MKNTLKEKIVMLCEYIQDCEYPSLVEFLEENGVEQSDDHVYTIATTIINELEDEPEEPTPGDYLHDL